MNYPIIPEGTRVTSACNIKIYQTHNGNPVLKLKWGDKEIYITTKQAYEIYNAAYQVELERSKE